MQIEDRIHRVPAYDARNKDVMVENSIASIIMDHSRSMAQQSMHSLSTDLPVKLIMGLRIFLNKLIRSDYYLFFDTTKINVFFRYLVAWTLSV